MCANKSLGSGNTFGFLQQKQKMYKMIESILGKQLLDFFVDVKHIILCVKSTFAGKNIFKNKRSALRTYLKANCI